MSRRAGLARARSALLVLLLLPGCTLLPPIDFQRMIQQNKFTVWQECPYFPDGRAMRTPPAETVPHDAPTGAPALLTGLQGDAYVADVPLPLTRDLLLAGKASFETYCAACHGLLGDGQSEVARHMELRKPPALAGQAARALPPGRIYQIIQEGYGLMRSYREDLMAPEERWAVVAYLQALKTSQGVPLESLPPSQRQEAERHLR